MKQEQKKPVKIRSRADLVKLSASLAPQMSMNNTTRVVVGMGTCGLAAGARQVYEAMEQELKAQDLKVSLEATGCVGICQFEPVVEVYLPDGTRTTYVRMTPERAVRVVRQHLRGGNSLAEFTIGASGNRR